MDPSAPKEDDIIAMKRDYKRQAFDREIRALFKQGRETIQSRHGTAMELGDERIELTCLNAYERLYDEKTSPEDHYCYFETLYNRNRDAILNTIDSDAWTTKRIYIQFGEGIAIKGVDASRSSRRIRSFRIMLAEIFTMAFELQNTAEAALDGIDEKFIQGAANKDLIRPNILLLHLMRIFYHLHDGGDRLQLGKIVTHLEADLGVTSKTVGSEPWIRPSAAGPPAGVTSGIAPLFAMATDMMTSMGYTVPAEMRPPTDADMQSMVSNVFNHPVAQNAIRGMLSGVEGCTDIPSALQQVMKSVSDPATMSAINETVMETAHFSGHLPPAGAAASSTPI